MDQKLIKIGLGIEDKDIVVTKVSNGFNIRIKKPKKIEKKEQFSFMTIMVMAGINMTICGRCGTKTYCHPHHIIPKSAGGKDDKDNGLPLCLKCHTGDEGIHLGKWKIEDVVPESRLNKLRERYGI